MGREPELEVLDDLWQASQAPGEHEVFVLLNAPGVGKTVLLNKFGSLLHEGHEGLFFSYQAAKTFTHPREFHRDLVKSLYGLVVENADYITDYVRRNHGTEDVAEDYMFILDTTKTDLKLAISADEIPMARIFGSFLDIARVIPVLFVVDEVQVLQETQFVNESGELESYLHYLTRILKSLLKARIFTVLSGTRFHILHQIGYKIGSPIRGKVQQIYLSKLHEEEITEYVKAVGDILAKNQSPLGSKNAIATMLDRYHQFLLGSSSLTFRGTEAYRLGFD